MKSLYRWLYRWMMTAIGRESFLQYGNGHPFEPEPHFVNHQCHWAPWAEHFRDHEGDIGTLANMLGYSLEENDRLLKRLRLYQAAYSRLLWAFIYLVETGKPEPFTEEDRMPNAWEAIQLINRWRAENKLNIRLVDIS